MERSIRKRPKKLQFVIYLFAGLWFIIAAFPFIWTIWGSFKVELDFFSIADWTFALTGSELKQSTAEPLQAPASMAHGFKKIFFEMW